MRRCRPRRVCPRRPFQRVAQQAPVDHLAGDIAPPSLGEAIVGHWFQPGRTWRWRIDEHDRRPFARRLVAQPADLDRQQATHAYATDDLGMPAGHRGQGFKIVGANFGHGGIGRLAGFRAHAAHGHDRVSVFQTPAEAIGEQGRAGDAVDHRDRLLADAAGHRHDQFAGRMLRYQRRDQAAEFTRCLGFEQDRGLQFDAEPLLHGKHQSLRHQRIAAEIEEIVVEADCRYAQLRGEDAGNRMGRAIAWHCHRSNPLLHVHRKPLTDACSLPTLLRRLLTSILCAMGRDARAPPLRAVSSRQCGITRFAGSPPAFSAVLHAL